MNKRQAKIEALEIASIAIDELISSDCTENAKVKKELNAISFKLSNQSYRLKHKILSNEREVLGKHEQNGFVCVHDETDCPEYMNGKNGCDGCEHWH